MRLAVFSFLLAFLMAGTLTGCGVKPAAVDPPAGAGKDKFPAVYPDPANDPAPSPVK